MKRHPTGRWFHEDDVARLTEAETRIARAVEVLDIGARTSKGTGSTISSVVLRKATTEALAILEGDTSEKYLPWSAIKRVFGAGCAAQCPEDDSEPCEAATAFREGRTRDVCDVPCRTGELYRLLAHLCGDEDIPRGKPRGDIEPICNEEWATIERLQQALAAERERADGLEKRLRLVEGEHVQRERHFRREEEEKVAALRARVAELEAHCANYDKLYQKLERQQRRISALQATVDAYRKGEQGAVLALEADLARERQARERAEAKLAAMSEGDKERASRRTMALVNGALEIQALTARAEQAEAEAERLSAELRELAARATTALRGDKR